MTDNKKRILLWLPAIIMMCIIFIFSMQPAEDSSETSGAVCRAVAKVTVENFDELKPVQQQSIIESLQHVVRKTAHFTEYALLGAAFLLPLWNISDNGSGKKRLRKRYAALLAVILSGLYACTDEFHQAFSPERSPQITDVCIDTLGALTGVVIVCLIVLIVKAIKRKKSV